MYFLPNPKVAMEPLMSELNITYPLSPKIYQGEEKHSNEGAFKAFLEMD
jgi:hypothetical protein